MTKQVRWKCPSCNHGILNSSRPRMNDVKRYCLPCSAKSGVLVQRTAPALEKKRDASKAKQSAKQSAKRKKVTAIKKQKKVSAKELRWNGDMNYDAEAKKLWKILEPVHNGAKLPIIQVKDPKRLNGAMGWSGGYFIVVKKGYGLVTDWQTLAHELVHSAISYSSKRYGTRHHDREFYNRLKEVTERRWKTNISFASVTKYGYNVDWLITQQLREQGVVKFPPRNKGKKQITEEVA